MTREKDGGSHPQDLYFALNFGHAHGRVDVVSFDELDSDLFAPGCMQAQFDLAELALAQRLEQQIRTELGDGASGVCGGVLHGGGVRVSVTVGGLFVCLRRGRYIVRSALARGMLLRRSWSRMYGYGYRAIGSSLAGRTRDGGIGDLETVHGCDGRRGRGRWSLTEIKA